MGVADDLFFQPVAAFGIGAGHLIAKRLLQMLDFTFQAAFLFVEKSLAVGDEKLRVANLRTVDGRIVDLGHNALGQGEPYAAGGRISGTNAVFGAGRPGSRKSCLANRIAAGWGAIAVHFYYRLPP